MTEVHKMFQTIHQSEKLLVVESPPQLRTIKVCRRFRVGREASNHAFYLSFPYMQFYLSRNLNFFLSFSKKPVRNLKQDEICFPFLPNVYVLGLRVCLDREMFGYNPYTMNFRSVGLEQFMENAVEAFWNSRFYFCVHWYGLWAVPDAIRKNDLDFSIDKGDFYDEAIGQFEAWEEGSRKEGVDFISNLDWPHTFKDLPGLWRSSKNFADHLGDDMKKLAAKCHERVEHD